MIKYTGFEKVWRFSSDYGLNIGIFGFFSWSFLFSPARGSNPLDYYYNSKAAGFVMTAAWFSQLAGAYLKRFPFQNRLGVPVEIHVKDDDKERSSLHPLYAEQESKIFFFMLMHPLISGLLLGTGISNIFPQFRNASEQFSWWTIPLYLSFAVALFLPTIFVAKAMFPLKGLQPRYKWMNEPWVEYIADQLFIFSFIILFSSIFGMPAMMQGIKPVNPACLLDWIYVIFLLIPLLWLGIMFFFIPFRILLMLENFGTWRSRLFSLLAISPIIIKYIFG